MDQRCLKIINSKTSVAYLNHKNIPDKMYRRYLLRPTDKIIDQIGGYYILYSIAGDDIDWSGDLRVTIRSVNRLVDYINRLCLYGLKYKKLVYSLVIKYSDRDFTNQIDITLDDPIFGATEMILNNELRESLYIHRAESSTTGGCT